MKEKGIDKRIGDICTVIAGQSPEGKYYNKSANGLPFFQGKKEFTDKYLGAPTTWTTKITKEALSGDILMSVRAPVGPVNFATDKICIGRGLAAIRASKEISKDYLFYYFIKHENEIIGNEGAVFNSINKSQIENLELFLPVLFEQKRIVKILDKAFDAIDKAKENAEKNLQNSKELFDSYLQSVFKNSGKDWGLRCLGDSDLLKIVDGDRGKNYPKKKDFASKGYCLFMNTKNVRLNGFDFTNNMFITKEKDLALGKGKIQRNDVVMTTRGTIGNLGLFSSEIPFENIRINSGMLIFRPNLDEVTPEYLFEVLRSGIMKMQIVKHVSGAAQPQLPIRTLINFKIPVPKSKKNQNIMVDKIQILSVKTKRLETICQQKLNNLEELKKSILQKAFNGELN